MKFINIDWPKLQMKFTNTEFLQNPLEQRSRLLQISLLQFIRTTNAMQPTTQKTQINTQYKWSLSTLSNENCKWGSQTSNFCKTNLSKEAIYYKSLFYSTLEAQIQCKPQPKRSKSTKNTNKVDQHWVPKIANGVHKHQIAARPTWVKKQNTTNLQPTTPKRKSTQ